jgi:capsule polysaccharide export protein KpsE/RkpR
VKQSRGVEISAHPLQAIEVPSDGNGLAEDLVETPVHRMLDRAWLLWESRRLLWHFTLCGLILATVIAFLLPKQYSSTARLMPPEKDTSSPLAMMAAMVGSGSSTGGGGGGESSLGQVANDLLGTKSQGALYTKVLEGRTIADGLIGRFDLRKVYGVRYWEDARKKLGKRTEISEDRKSGIIVIKVTDRDPHRAAQMAQAYVEELNRLIAAVSTSAARRERIFIEQRLKTAKQDMDTAAKQFSEFASQNTAIDIPEQGKAMVDAAAVLQGQLIAAQSEVEGLSQIYTDSNVRLRSARARVAELQRQLVKMGGDNASFGSGAGGPVSDPASVPKNVDPSEIYPAIRKIPLLGVRWADLYLENKIQEKVYELLTSQYEVSRIEEAKETPSVQAYDVADIPEKKSWPPRLLIMALGAVLSFCVGAVWIMGRKAWQEVDLHDPRKQFAYHVGREIRVSGLRSVEQVLERFGDNRFTKRLARGSTTEMNDLQKSE